MGTPFGATTLNGTTQYGLVSQTTDYDTQRSVPLTVDISFKGSAAGPLVNKHDGTTGWKLEVTAGAAIQVTLNAATFTGGSSLLDGEWHQIRLVVQWNSRRAYLFVDGASQNTSNLAPLTTLDNTADMYLGRDGSDYFAGTLSQLRLSNVAKLGGRGDTENYDLDSVQFADDADTLGLWHFNEGIGTTVYDMHASSSRSPMTMYNTPTWADGDMLADPTTIVLDQCWLALDSYTQLTTWLTARNGIKYYARDREAVPDGWNIENAPGLKLYIAEQMPEIPPETFGDIYQFNIPVVAEGAMPTTDERPIRQFWFVVWSALVDFCWVQSNGNMGNAHVQNMKIGGPRIDGTETDNNVSVHKFSATFTFEMRAPWRT